MVLVCICGYVWVLCVIGSAEGIVRCVFSGIQVQHALKREPRRLRLKTREHTFFAPSCNMDTSRGALFLKLGSGGQFLQFPWTCSSYDAQMCRLCGKISSWNVPPLLLS